VLLIENYQSNKNEIKQIKKKHVTWRIPAIIALCRGQKCGKPFYVSECSSTHVVISAQAGMTDEGVFVPCRDNSGGSRIS
jgi:hypothetical protein